MSDLKPCPFCGGKPYMTQNYLGQKYVRCPECGACVWGKDTDDWRIATMGEKKAEKAAVEAWNRRTGSKSKWIPVSEKLPEDSETVLITHKGGVSFGWYNGSYWEGGASTKHRPLQTVIAWMPLPKRYRGD